MDDVVEIYGIAEQVGEYGYLRYVGKADNTEKRLASHARDMRRRHSKLYVWLREAMKRPEKPYAMILCWCKRKDWPEVERQMIAQWKAWGEPLLNCAEGGNQPPACLKAILAENGRKNARAIHDDPVRKARWKLAHMIGCARRTYRGKYSLPATNLQCPS